MLVLPACSALDTSASKSWSPDQVQLATAEIHGNLATVRHVRNCTYRTEKDVTVGFYDKTFDLDRIRSVDFIVVPFEDFSPIAHTFLSFGFEGDEYLAISIEVRRKQGEGFDPIKGLLSGYDIMYVVGDERDLIAQRTNARREEVYVYRTKASRGEARQLFVDMLERANHLAEQPEKYNLITNNCTTNVRKHINRLARDSVPYGYKVLFTGYSDQLAYDLGLLDTDLSFAKTKEAARINPYAYIYRDDPQFSARIRQAAAEEAVARLPKKADVPAAGTETVLK